MAKQTLIQQTATTDISDDDIVYVVRSTNTTPVDRKMRYADLKAKIMADNALASKVTATYADAVALSVGNAPILFMVLASEQNSNLPTLYFYPGFLPLYWVASVGLN